VLFQEIRQKVLHKIRLLKKWQQLNGHVQVDNFEILDVNDYDNAINKAKSLVADSGTMENRCEFVVGYLNDHLIK
jgi:UDP-N-acetylglucosamine 2-epimerase